MMLERDPQLLPIKDVSETIKRFLDYPLQRQTLEMAGNFRKIHPGLGQRIKFIYTGSNSGAS